MFERVFIGTSFRLAAIVLFALLSACAPQRQPVPPGTIPEARAVSVDEEQYGHTVLTQLSQQFQLDFDDPRLNTITDIVDKLTASVKADKHPWHVYLFKAPKTKNAAATRGNHVFVWSGLLDVTENENEISAILAHEIAHVLAGHTDPDPNEEARKMLIQLGAVAAGIAVASATNDPTIANNLGELTAQLTQGLGSELLVFPYSREMELEADHIGMLILASAGYDPQACIDFWSRLQNHPELGSQMKYFSSHPPAEERLVKLREALPLAQAIYRGEKPAPRISTGGASKKNSEAKPDKTLNVLKPGKGNGIALSRKAKKASERRAKASGTEYTVLQDGVILYRAPSRQSTKIGEFTSGARVLVTDTIDDWLEVDSPDHGYIEAGSAEAR